MHTALSQAGVGHAARKPGLSWPRDTAAYSSIRTAAQLWLASKVAIVMLAWVASWTMRPALRQPLRWASLWQHWDAIQFRVIAEYGYFGPAGASMPNQDAFLPGYPLALRAVHLVIPQWTIDELALASVASFFAIIGLVRLAEDYRAGSGAWAGVFLLAAPAAIFLAVGYSEALFLAFALPAWRAARGGAWMRASLLMAGACAVRVSGLFVLAGLVVMALCSRRWPALPYLLSIPLVPVAGYELFLHDRTGDWLAWLHAEQSGWRRSFGNPVRTFDTTWQVAFEHLFRTPLAFAFQLELIAVLALLGTVIAALWQRHWPEACYCALMLGALVAGHWYFSVPRAVLLAWPLWCGLARLAQRHRWVAGLWLAAFAPLMFVTALLYLDGKWAG